MSVPLKLSEARDGSARYRYRKIEFTIRMNGMGWSSGEVRVAGTDSIAWIYGFNAWTKKGLLKKVAKRIDKDYEDLEIKKALGRDTVEAVTSRLLDDDSNDWETIEARIERALREDRR
jgi:hypothetical protein